MNRELLEKIIDLTLDQVREKGWDLLDEDTNTQVQTVADAIEREVDEFIEDYEFEREYEEATRELRNSVMDDEEDEDMIVLDDGPLNPTT